MVSAYASRLFWKIGVFDVALLVVGTAVAVDDADKARQVRIKSGQARVAGILLVVAVPGATGDAGFNVIGNQE